jgi:hypothetical protein
MLGVSLGPALPQMGPLSGVASAVLPSPVALRTVGSRNYRRVEGFLHKLIYEDQHRSIQDLADEMEFGYGMSLDSYC